MMIKSVILFTLLLTCLGMAVSSSNGHRSQSGNIKQSTDCQCPAMSNGRQQPFVLCGKEMINKQNCIPEAKYVCRNGKVPVISHICSEFITVTACSAYTKLELDNERDPDLKELHKIDRQCVKPNK